MDYRDYVTALEPEYPELAEELARFNTLESVLHWMQVRGFPLATIEIVFQDEFSHDFLLPLEPEGRYLVFGIT
jgi:hypothetical protein